MQMKDACIRPTLWLSHHAHNPLPSTLLTAKQVDLWNWKSRQMALLVPGIVSGASLHLACSKDELDKTGNYTSVTSSQMLFISVKSWQCYYQMCQIALCIINLKSVVKWVKQVAILSYPSQLISKKINMVVSGEYQGVNTDYINYNKTRHNFKTQFTVTYRNLTYINKITVVWTTIMIFHNTTTSKNFFIRALYLCWWIFKLIPLSIKLHTFWWNWMYPGFVMLFINYMPLCGDQ